MFARQMATRPLKYSGKFWRARSGSKKYSWITPLAYDQPQKQPATATATFDAVVHFVQSSSGTGVHIGNGKILTCAHVIETRDDVIKSAKDPSYMPNRIGRRKIIMFASGRTFLAKCREVLETLDGSRDVALLDIQEEMNVGPDSDTGTESILPPAAKVASDAVSRGAKLFCIGNPSNVDLESQEEEELELEPPAWHVSVGTCEGYLDPSNHKKMIQQNVSDRPPKHGGSTARRNAAPVEAEAGSLLLHSCWTYWGHSGAPLFDECGKVVGLHCAWDERSGIRHGQNLHHIHEILSLLSRLTEQSEDAK